MILLSVIRSSVKSDTKYRILESGDGSDGGGSESRDWSEEDGERGGRDRRRGGIA